MYQNLLLFQTAAAMAQHAGTRQAVVASNVANADTPHYQAQQMDAFKDIYQNQNIGEMRATRSGHLGRTVDISPRSVLTSAGTEPSPNGNTVSVEDEMLAAVDVGREHSRALAIYRHGMTVLRTTLGR